MVICILPILEPRRSVLLRGFAELPQMAWDVGCRSRCGRDERSCNPANPSRRYRSTHLRMVREQTPAPSATASGVCPLSTCRTIRSRPRREPGILMHVHPVSPRNLKLQQPQLPRSKPDGQPTESSKLANNAPSSFNAGQCASAQCRHVVFCDLALM
jgi:hypothetical protein